MADAGRDQSMAQGGRGEGGGGNELEISCQGLVGKVTLIMSD